uniref:Subtilisin-like protease SBT1.1 n=1 Tax=Kalanchoe fedtschenkoi TaxID=63787 RepID=A0A7N0T0A9_KALFE
MGLGSFTVCTLLLWTMAASTASDASQTYIIHIDASKVENLERSLQETRQMYESMIKLSADDGLETSAPQLLYVYQTAMSGFAAKLSIEQSELLKKADGVLSVTPDELLSLHTTYSPQFLDLLDGEGLWRKSEKMASSDVIVGIVDTGIWPEHGSFRDTNMPPVPSKWRGSCETGRRFSRSNCNRKLIGARFFYKGYESSIGKINRTEEFLSPRDSHGHGTHTASTAAGNRIAGASMLRFANGTASGISPGSRIAAYKACWAQGCASSDLMAAIDRAVADGVDVLSLSLGGFPKPYYGDSIAIASFGAVQKGVFVSCSAGNLGPLSSSVSNTAPWIMTVGASSMDRHFPAFVKLGSGRQLIGSSLYPGEGADKLPVVYRQSAGGDGAEFCTNGTLDRRLVKGKIVVCEYGIISRTAKGAEVKKAGGAGMLLLNHENAGEELLADAHVLPAASLGASAAKILGSYLNSSNPTASMSFKGTTYGDLAPRVSAFSSRGPNAVDLDVIKPDVIAPGLNILAAWPPTISPSMLDSDKRRVNFNILSGTSMSCPHVSGAAALLKSVHPRWSPAAIKSALMTTAYTVNNRLLPISDSSGSAPAKDGTPFTFGSGHVDPERASDPGLIYDMSATDYLRYLCGLNYSSSQISAFAGGNFTCPPNPISHSGRLNYPSFAVNFISPNTSLIHTRTVTNVGEAPSTYRLQVVAPEGVRVSVQPRTLPFRNLGQKLSYRVRFTSLKSFSGATGPSFGSIMWVSGHYRVRSPVAIAWL